MRFSQNIEDNGRVDKVQITLGVKNPVNAFQNHIQKFGVVQQSRPVEVLYDTAHDKLVPIEFVLVAAKWRKVYLKHSFNTV